MAISSRNGRCSSFVASVPSNGTGRAFATSFNLPSHDVLNTGKSNSRKMYMAVFEWIKFVQRFFLVFSLCYPLHFLLMAIVKKSYLCLPF